MKKIITLVAVCIAVLACKQEKPLEDGNYRINGTVTGLENGEVYLINYPDVDTVIVKNGKFTIENNIKEKVQALYMAKSPNLQQMKREEVASLLIEPKIMDLDLNYQDFSKSKLTGSISQDDQYRLDKIRIEIADNYKEEQNYFDSVREKYSEAAKAGASEEELEAIKYEDNDARGKLEPMWEKQKEATLQFIKDNPKSYVSLQSLRYQISDLKYNEAKAILEQLNPAYLKTELGKGIINDIEKLRIGIPGAKAANFETVDINGDSLKLDDFKGKYVLIDFWASWCVPCRKGNPHLISLYNKYHPKGLEILGVSDDDRAHDKWKKAVEKDGIGIWHHVLRGLEYKKGTYERINMDKDISDSYNIHTLPTKILVGPDGIIVGRYGGGGEDDAAMDAKLAELFETN
ncbi:Thiol-disulfide oxidoreductase ResA [Mariniflexile rhizosphaerae]|uniref:TlpA disulfide reductase family protein n=1 Tax=unclassified Mariniflexile TaxID=2643887 RepID=UPI000CAA226D|nr:TlpA disulfide reductase family protein [Mariniflexile sp. TRM1-10]AXP82174.1 Thiol-disulfide oxidoreductase ResA [Mariniflexile sp. TRM1-10]PLB19264.1 MAG: Thiol:disulfide interchange protein [Flavobacteriaceae bacterium FS1-H7996/R]